MRGNPIRIVRIGGLDIQLDASWVLMTALIIWHLAYSVFPVALPEAELATHLVMAFVVMAGLFASLILHELCHAIVAKHFGRPNLTITMYLFGGVADLQSAPDSRHREIWLAVAGPIASALIALAFWGDSIVSGLAAWPGAVTLVLQTLAWMNVSLAVLNLLPAFPLDGGRIFRVWLLGRSGDLLSSTRHAVHVSTGIAYGLVGIAIVALLAGSAMVGFWPLMIGLSLLAGARSALSRIESQTQLDDLRVADLMAPDPWTAQPDMTLSELVNHVILRHAITFVPVVEHGRLLGYVDSHMVQRISRENWATTTVEDVIEPVSPRNAIPPQMTGQALLAQIQSTGQHKFVVTERDELCGVVAATDLLALLGQVREVR